MLSIQRTQGAITLLAVLAGGGMGAGWRQDVAVDWETNQSNVSSYQQAVEEMQERTAHLGTDELVARCRQVIEASPATRLEGRYTSTGAALWMDWVLCGAALRRIGGSGEERWLPLLDELHPEWTHVVVASDGRLLFAMDCEPRCRGRPLFHLVSNDAANAYRSIAFADATTEEILAARRDDLLKRGYGGTISTARGAAALRAYHDIRNTELSREPEYLRMFHDPEPSVRRMMANEALRTGAERELVPLLADTDVSVRQEAERQLMSGRARARVVPALVDFLNRDDIDDAARASVEAALRMQGHSAVRNADGQWEAMPTEPNEEGEAGEQ